MDVGQQRGPLGRRTNAGAHAYARHWGRWLYGGVLEEGNTEEPLLRPFGLDVDVQRACVVLAESFVVSSGSCLLMLSVIMLHWLKALHKKGLHTCKCKSLNVP